MGAMSERVPLFVRLTAEQARQLDDHVQRVGRSKQDVVGRLLASSMAMPDDGAPVPGSVGQAAAPVPTPVALTVSEVAAALQVDEAAVNERIDAGDLPARRLGDEWRVGREALADWLGESDVRRPAGFRPTA